MNALLTPEQIDVIRERDDGAASAASEGAPVGQAAIDRHLLLSDREAIAERLEAILRGKSMNAYGTHSVDASAVSALVTAIRGNQGDSK